MSIGTTSYATFLEAKRKSAKPLGVDIARTDVHPLLHDWQAEIVQWACHIGRAAVWADTGLGKTLMQIEWVRIMAGDGLGLIVAPLAVCHQTVKEAARVGVDLTYVRSGDGLTSGLFITNYEMLDHFDPTVVRAVVLDEASILKSSDGKTRKRLISHFAETPYRLACTATPAPNDVEELTNQAEFLGVTTRVNMLAAYFVHDSDAGWRLKGHAKGPMYRWMASWAVALRRPSDMGYPDDGYQLPGLEILPHLLPVDIVPDDQLFATELGGVGGRAKIRRQTLDVRVARVAEIVAAEPDEPWVLWCGLNDEADALARLIPGSVNVPGTWTVEQKAEALNDFADGRLRVLIIKPQIAAFGLNWQHCARMAFVGLNDSYEAYYQAIRRCYRYGQTRVVHAHVVLSDLEGQIAVNVARKEREASGVMAALVSEMHAARETSRSINV